MVNDGRDDETDTPSGHVPLRTRLSGARALLEEGTGSEYELLSARQQARIQEAIECLRQAEDGFAETERGPRRADGGHDAAGPRDTAEEVSGRSDGFPGERRGDDRFRGGSDE